MVCLWCVLTNQIKFHPSKERWNLGYTFFPIVMVKNGCCVSAHLLGPFFFLCLSRRNTVKTK